MTPRLFAKREALTSGTASQSPPITSTITIVSGGAFNTGCSNQDVDRAATQDGNFGTLNHEVVGENAHPHFLDGLTSGHWAARGVIAYTARVTVQRIAAVLSAIAPRLKVAKQSAFAAVDVHKSALLRQLVLLAEFRAAGSPLPKKHNRWIVALKFVVLFAGDWALIAVGFQLFGLSDKPWIPGIGFTDDLHLAAISAVATLIFLGDRSGVHLARIEHDLERRRGAPKDKRMLLPRPAGLDAFLLLLWLSTAVVALLALSNIRTEYLLQNGIDANASAFLLLQLAIFASALALGYAHAPNPEAERWQRKLEVAEGAVRATRTAQDAASTGYVDLIGQYNGEVLHIDAEVAGGGHHVRTDRDSVGVQLAAYPRAYLLAQPGDQIAQSSILSDGFDELPAYTDEELLKALTGVTPLPVFRLLSTASFEQHLANARAEVSRLRARIDQKEIDSLSLPELQVSEAEPVSSDETKSAAEVTTAANEVTQHTEQITQAVPRLVPVEVADAEHVVGAEVIKSDSNEESA